MHLFLFISTHQTAGSEGDLASSSEGDEISRLAMTSGQTSGHCSPFSRRQFPRDSGCYDAHKNPTRRTLSPEHSSTKASQENNLDAVMPAKCSTSIEGNSHTDFKDDFHRNIPITGGSASRDCHAFDKSCQQLRSNTPGNVRFIAKRGNFGETVVIGEDSGIGSHKLTPMTTKYGLGGCSDLGIGCESTGVTTPAGLGQRGCLSEKSSDSGVSSSSLSSAPPPRDKALTVTGTSHIAAANVAASAAATVTAATTDSPTKNFGNFPRGSPTSQANKSSTNETSTYQ